MQIFIGGETGKGKVKPNPPGPSLPPIFNKKLPVWGRSGQKSQVGSIFVISIFDPTLMLCLTQ